MKRIKLTVAYDGTSYSGWQIQPAAPTIEKVLDEAVYQVTGERLHVTGASRTDAGVHALGNVAVFDTESTIPGRRWSYAINRYLPEDVCVQESREVKLNFHPRHCNTEKTYEYQIYNAEFANPKMRNYAWHVAGQIDIDAMKAAAKILIGEHDFKSFCCVRTQVESTVRTIYDIEVLESAAGSMSQASQTGTGYSGGTSDIAAKMIVIRVIGNGFLYNMVRIIAGTLIQVGKGQKTPEDVRHMLDERNRCAAGQTAPPQGLTLIKIDYIDGDDEENI